MSKYIARLTDKNGKVTDSPTVEAPNDEVAKLLCMLSLELNPKVCMLVCMGELELRLLRVDQQTAKPDEQSVVE